MSSLKKAQLRVVSTCEGAFDVSEQFGLDQRRGQSSAINRHKRFLASQSLEVDGSRDQFFSCSGLSYDQNRGGVLADLSYDLVKKIHRSGFADQLAKSCLARRRRA